MSNIHAAGYQVSSQVKVGVEVELDVLVEVFRGLVAVIFGMRVGCNRSGRVLGEMAAF